MRRASRLGVVGLVVVGMFACAHVEPLSNAYAPMADAVGERCVARGMDASCELFEVALTELIAVPEKFHGRKVRVIGYATLTFEGNTLCPSGRSLSGKECVWLDIEGLEDPGFRKGHALIEGHFDGEARGHLGCCGGGIRGISRFERWR
jgi:hypothetical protein